MNKPSIIQRLPDLTALAKSLRLFAPRSLLILSLLAFLVILFIEAWLHEDAFITLRTIDNFVNGYGLRYNVSQRVQTYTHPLWMFLLAVPYSLTQEPLFTTIFVSIAVSLTTLFLLLRYLAPSPAARLVAAFLLLLSRPFVDYSTAGLENPLTHLLLVLFLILYLREPQSRQNLFWLSFLAALAAVNRLDTLLFFLPPLLVYTIGTPSLLTLFLGFMPLVGWVLFSLIYYGFPIPNSAYAKLNVHIPAGQLFRQGIFYFQDILWRDPLSSATIFAGLIAGFLERERKKMMVALGVVLYLLYILRIGGDYMSGRFFTAPLIVAVVLLVQSPWLNALSRRRLSFLIVAICCLSFLAAHPVIGSFDYQRRFRTDHGITDERQYYEAHTGLLANLVPDPPLTRHWLADDGIRAREEGQELLIKGGIGLAGYFAGPDVHIVDNYALADTLLSHLPVGNPDFWRIGHFNRKRPAGLERSLLERENRLQDAEIARYYDKLMLVFAGPLFDWDRYRAIWQLNTGQLDHFIDPERYIADQMPLINPDHLVVVLPAHSRLADENVISIPYEGVKLKYAYSQHPSLMTLGMDDNYAYRFIFLREGEVLGSLLSEPQGHNKETLGIRAIPLPADITTAGFDEIRIRPYLRGMDPKLERGLGYLVFSQESSGNQ